jgi:hypothetical protein
MDLLHGNRSQSSANLALRGGRGGNGCSHGDDSRGRGGGGNKGKEKVIC